jgi:hypothetical protein
LSAASPKEDRMRRMSAALVAITAAIALVALAAPAWPKAKPKAKPKPWALVVSPSEVRSGQMVTVSGGGCQGTGILRLFIDQEEFHSTSTRSGKFSYQVRLPRGLESGSHNMGAECRGSKHTPAYFNVKHKNRYGDDDCEEGYQDDENEWSQENLRHGEDENGYGGDCEDKKDSRRASFNVSPDVVIAGDKVWAEGTGCKRYSPVTIKLDGWPIKWTHADRHGTFDKGIRLPRDIRKGRHLFSAKCGGRHIGSDGIKVKKEYKQHPWGIHSNGSIMQAGKKLRIKGDDCPYGAPTAKLDENRLHLNVLRKGKGFTAEATIPRGTAPGNHKLYAGCDGGSYTMAPVSVLDPEDSAQDARQAFSSQPTNELALGAGLFAGLALLVASVFLTTRRRANRG